MRKKETEMVVEHLQVRDMERQILFEQQIEELHSCKMKVEEQKLVEEEEDEEVFKRGLQLKTVENKVKRLRANYKKVGWITERKGTS